MFVPPDLNATLLNRIEITDDVSKKKILINNY